jgi:hypothetical protein
MGKLEKKLVLTLNYYGLTVGEKIEKETDIANAHQSNPSEVPGLTPAPSAVLNLIDDLNQKITLRDTLKAQVKALTGEIRNDNEDILNILMDQWRPQTQTAIGNDMAKAKLLGWGIKGIDSGHTAIAVQAAKAESSTPYISRIDINVREQHTVHIINNITGKRKIPAGVLCTDVYCYIGEAGLSFTDLSQMITAGGTYLGQARWGKFANTIPGKKGKTAYYIAVYVNKKTKKPMTQSPVESAIIN